MENNKKSVPLFTAPKDILNSIELEENNGVVEDLNKKISESTTKKAVNSKYRRKISPERSNPMQNISKLNKNQNLNQRSYKEIMLEQKKLEEKEKMLKNEQQRIFFTQPDRKSNQYNNINYNSRTLNPMSRKDNNENYSIYTKETKLTSEINKYGKSENDDFLSHKRKNNTNESEEEGEEFKFDKSINNERNNSIIKNEEKDKSEILSSFKKNEIENNNDNDNEDYSSENYDIPTPKNESESDSEVTEINEKNKKEKEEENINKKEEKYNKNIIIKDEEEEINKNMIEENKEIEKNKIDFKINEELKYNLDFIERNRPLTY